MNNDMWTSLKSRFEKGNGAHKEVSLMGPNGVHFLLPGGV